MEQSLVLTDIRCPCNSLFLTVPELTAHQKVCIFSASARQLGKSVSNAEDVLQNKSDSPTTVGSTATTRPAPIHRKPAGKQHRWRLPPNTIKKRKLVSRPVEHGPYKHDCEQCSNSSIPRAFASVDELYHHILIYHATTRKSGGQQTSETIIITDSESASEPVVEMVDKFPPTVDQVLPFCNICTLKFDSPWSLEMHCHEFHVRCGNCNHWASNLTELLKHCSAMKHRAPTTCHVCYQYLKSSTALQTHMRTEHEECSCGIALVSLEALLLHCQSSSHLLPDTILGLGQRRASGFPALGAESDLTNLHAWPPLFKLNSKFQPCK